MDMEMHKDLPVLLFTSQDDWRAWLDTHHTQPTGIWMKFAKKASGKSSISYDQAIEEALCYGWIDGIVNAYNDDYWLQKFVARKPKSVWSKINVAKVEALIKSGKMQPAGLATVETAKQNGNWDNAYAGSSTMTIPEDFQAALDKNPKAKAFYQTLNKTNTYAFCWQVHTAKRPETRKARIEKFITMLNNGEKLR